MLTSSLRAAAQLPPTVSQAPVTHGPATNPPTDAASGLHDPARPWVNKPLLLTGTTLMVAGYVPALVVSQLSDRPEDRRTLAYPVAGPWLRLTDDECGERPCRNEERNRGLLVADGIVQGVGALGVVLSLILPDEATENWPLLGNTKVVPMRVGGRSYGLGAVGTF